MRLARVRIRTLMIAAAVVAIILAGFMYDPARALVLAAILVATAPFWAFLVYYARKLGLNTLFR